jgi:putative permease
MLVRDVLRSWGKRFFYDEETVFFALLLLGVFSVVIFFGKILLPFFIALVIAFLLQGLVGLLLRMRLPRIVAVLVSFCIFLGFSAGVLIWLLPLLWEQLVDLIKELPSILRMIQEWFLALQEAYPQVLSEEYVGNLLSEITKELRQAGQLVLSFSMANIPNLVAWLIYLILVPILVLFMLKDQRKLMSMVTSLLPSKRVLLEKIWIEMDSQIANYVRGKVIEIIIVGVVSWIVFVMFKLRYAELLALMVGISVVVPYVGASVVTIPVTLVALFQFGWSSTFAWVVVAYMIIQILDGNVLVPLLFSEVVNLHPVSIILAVLFFGGIWGFWGVFLAIPLATLFKTIFLSWPRDPEENQLQTE